MLWQGLSHVPSAEIKDHWLANLGIGYRYRNDTASKLAGQRTILAQ
jgi:hypothetical protein